MNHILRNFLYLDTQLVNDYLSSIEGGIYEETIVEKKESIVGGNVEGGISILKGAGKKEAMNGSETTRQIKRTDSSNFQRLYNYIEKDDELGYFELITPEVWSEFKRNEIIEGIGSLRFSKMEEMIGLVNQLSTFANVIETITGQTPINEEAFDSINGLQALDKTQHDKGIPAVFSFVSSPNYRLISYLNPNYLKVSKEQIIGEINILCKIQRIVGKNEKIELVDFMPGLKNLSRGQRRNFPKNTSAPAELRDTIKGPAAIVIPIAIYR